MNPKQLALWFKQHPFSLFIFVAIFVTVVMTSVSMWLYKSSGAANLDLSRPGYESVRTEVQDDNTATQPYSATGDLDSNSISDFRNRYQKIIDKLGKTSNYDESDMTDANLGLDGSTTNTDPTN